MEEIFSQLSFWMVFMHFVFIVYLQKVLNSDPFGIRIGIRNGPEYEYNLDPDPQHWICQWFLFTQPSGLSAIDWHLTPV